jgi:hypothetical protein
MRDSINDPDNSTWEQLERATLHPKVQDIYRLLERADFDVFVTRNTSSTEVIDMLDKFLDSAILDIIESLQVTFFHDILMSINCYREEQKVR